LSTEVAPIVTAAWQGFVRHDVPGKAGRLSVRVGGAEHGAPVLLCHSILTSSAIWHRTAMTLAASGWRVICPDTRGHGRSDAPAGPYTIDDLVADDIAVLDALKIPRAIFVGHSIAGTEVFKLGAAYPDRVIKLVTLDGLDNAGGGWDKLPQPPPAPDLTPEDLQSVQHLAAALARSDGYRKPLPAICNLVRTGPSGKVIGPVTPPEINSKVLAGLQLAQYDQIKAPTLGMFSKVSANTRIPYCWDLSPAKQEEFRRNITRLAKWTDGAIERFR